MRNVTELSLSGEDGFCFQRGNTYLDNVIDYVALRIDQLLHVSTSELISLRAFRTLQSDGKSDSMMLFQALASIGGGVNTENFIF